MVLSVNGFLAVGYLDAGGAGIGGATLKVVGGLRLEARGLRLALYGGDGVDDILKVEGIGVQLGHSLCAEDVGLVIGNGGGYGGCLHDGLAAGCLEAVACALGEACLLEQGAGEDVGSVVGF